MDHRVSLAVLTLIPEAQVPPYSITHGKDHRLHRDLLLALSARCRLPMTATLFPPRRRARAAEKHFLTFLRSLQSMRQHSPPLPAIAIGASYAETLASSLPATDGNDT